MAKSAVSDWTQHSPITEFIEPFKRKSRVHYGFHGYFTSQPFNVVSQYIGHYSREGELVADPFCGSGVTAVESLRLKRRAFALDLNPFAVLLTQTKCSYVDLEKFKSLYERILSEVTEECEHIESLPEASEDLKIPYWYPKKVKLPRDSDVDFLDEIFSRKQLYQLALIKSHIDKIRSCPEKDLLLIQFCGTMRRANKAYSLPNDGRPATAGDFTIFQTGRYRIPKRVVTLPVLPSFIDKFNSLVQAKRETNPFFKDFVNEKTLDCEIGSATDLRPYLKSKSVDYIYTDPPYGAHIRYLDLSTVYNSWLKYEISEKSRKQEAIEGGEVNNTTEEYTHLLEKSFAEMSRILKPTRWLSLVFHHKEATLWTRIVEMARATGLEYKNTVVQHTKLPSWHKVDQPQSVLASQIIVNFIRKDDATFFFASSVPLHKLIYNVAEREIVKRGGATLEEICNALVPELFEHNYSDQTAQVQNDKIHSILIKEFDYHKEEKIYKLKADQHKKLGSYIPMRERIASYLISYLRRERRATLDELLPAILPLLINGEVPTGIEILDELKKVATFDGDYWVFKSSSIQASLEFDAPKVVPMDHRIPSHLSEHDQIIYRLALLANRYELIAKIGDQEQREPYLKAINQHPVLESNELKAKEITNINNIDCLWFAKSGDKPIFAFEVEHSTTVVSAFERFISLLKMTGDVGNDRRLILVISRGNKGIFNTAIRQSSYIGAPHYLNNKIRFMYEEEFIGNFSELMQERRFAKFEGLLRSPELG